MTSTDQKQWRDYGVTGRTTLFGVVLTVLAAVSLLANPDGGWWILFGALGGLLLHAGIFGYVIKGVLREVRDER